MKAVLMAGGAGSRLRPLTVERPKPMIPVVNKPIMEHVLDVLKRNGFLDVVVTLQYRADTIQHYFQTGDRLGINLSYSVEEVPLGTAGSVRHAGTSLTETFVVASADALTDFDLGPAVHFHRCRHALATMVLTKVVNPLEYGVIMTEADGRITRFHEKPGWGDLISDTINSGIYIFEPEILNWIPAGQASDWSRDIFPRLLASNQPVYGYTAEGYWCDVGDVPEYFRACTDLLSGRVRLPALGKEIGGGICTGENVEIAPDAQLFGPIYLGNDVVVKSGAIIQGPTSIGAETVVDYGANIDRCHIWDRSYIGSGSELHGAVVGQRCSLKGRSILLNGVIVGDNNVVGEKAILHQDVKIWPGKEIEAGAVVKSSLIWSAKGRRALFGRFGVTGVVNVDLTPEFMARLGASFAATLPKSSWVVINHGLHRSARMLKRALVAGLSSAGINVWDLRGVPVPMARYYTRVSDAAAGVDVRLAPHDSRVVDVSFMNSAGQNLDRDEERTVEWVHFREDFRRADMDDIGTIENPAGVADRYSQGFLQAIAPVVIRRAGFRVVVDYSNAPSSLVLPSILTALNVNVVPLNAQVDEQRPLSWQPEAQERWLQQLARIVNVLDTDFGVQLNTSGEKIVFVTQSGALIPDDLAALMMAELALHANSVSLSGVSPPKIAVPLNQTARFEEIARHYHAEVVRTKVDQQALMQASTDPRVILAADGRGGFIFPAFQPVFDALMALAKLMEFMALLNTSVSLAIASLPSFFIAHGYTMCDWEKKGQVMRLLNNHFQGVPAENLDGLKLFLDQSAWVLIRPDPYKPGFKVAAESPTRAQAEKIVQEYQQMIKSLARV